MARTSLNVIKFTEYNQAIYPFDYYIECESTTTGKLTVVESNASTNQINWDDDSLIGADGNPLFSAYADNKYVLKVLGFFKQPDAITKEFEFKMPDRDEKYILVVKNTVSVPFYYIECEAATDGKITVKQDSAGEGEINWNDDSLIGADGNPLFSSDPTGTATYVLKVSGDKVITIKKGDSVQGVEDVSYSLRHGGTYYIVLESGRFKNVTSNDKGKVILEATDTYVEAAILCLK